jgi:enoyl-CoA hydratase
MSEPLLVERDDAVAIVTLNRPGALNATDSSLHTALAGIWATLAKDADIRAVLLTGAGSAFSAGGDLNLLDEMVADRAVRDRVMAEARQLVLTLLDLPQAVVAAVNGPAVGLGCSLTSMCDLVVMEEQAYLSDPHVALGLVAGDGAALTWPLQLGNQRAREWIYFGGRMSAKEALAAGLANRVVPAGESAAVALQLARKLAALPAQALQATRRGMNRTLLDRLASTLDDLLAAEAASFDEPEFRGRLERLPSR